MAYGFNDNRSKAFMYTQEQVDELVGGGGGDCNCITVIETEQIYTEDGSVLTYTYTNATALFDAFEDIAANPTHIFNYGVVESWTTSPEESGLINCRFLFGEDGTITLMGDTASHGYVPIFDYDPNEEHIVFTYDAIEVYAKREDVAQDDTVSFSVNGGVV